MKLIQAGTLINGWLIECRLVSIKTTQQRLLKQTHDNNIVWINKLSSLVEGDGVAVKRKDNLMGSVITSDCLPLVLLTSKVAMVLHVSRKTLIRGLLERVDNFIDVASISDVFIGPHICAQHFVFKWVGSEIQEFKTMFPQAVFSKEDGNHLSIREAVQSYLKKWGVQNNSITEDERCTYEDEQLPSYRRLFEEGKKNPVVIETSVISIAKH